MSATAVRQCAAIVDLAAEIEADIHRRGLRPGDPYQGTVETARMLKTGMTPVNQAMRLLVKRNVLERRQKVGTFVGISAGNGRPAPELKQVHVLLYDHHLVDEGIFGSGLLMGLQSLLPGTHIQFDFIPPASRDEEPYLQELIDEALRSRGSEAFVLFNSTLEMQRNFRDSGLPTVIAGSLYASIEGLPHIDRDQKQVGRLLAEYLLSRGHKRILMIARQRPGMGPGEYLAADAVGEVAAKANLAANALVTRCLPHDPNVIQCEIRRLLENSDELPGILLRPWQMIDPVCAAIESLGLKPQRDVAVAVADYYQPMSTAPPYPVIRSEWSLEQLGAHMARLLLAKAKHRAREADNEVVIPVRLEVPDAL